MFAGRLEGYVSAVAVCVAIFVGCQGNVDPEDELIAKLKDKNPKERAAAAFVLSQRTDIPEKFVPHMLEALNDNDPEVRLSIARGFGELGVAGRAHLSEIGRLSTEHPDNNVRFELQRAFERIRNSQ